MDNKIHVVDQNPIGLVIALHLIGGRARFLQAQLYLVGDGLNLPGILAGTDEEVVGECR